MEVVVGALAAKAIELLTPYLKKGFEKFSEEVGKTAAEKIKNLFNTIKEKFSNDTLATDTFTRYEKDPGKYETYAKDVLGEKLAQDKDLISELDNRLNELGPILELIQKMKSVDGKVVGLDADEVGDKAKIRVIQELDDVKKNGDVIGAKIKKIG